MIDFRYHALSLVAVFLALGIGIVLGVTVGDSLVSDADRNLRESLREDLFEAREEVRDERDLADKREDVIEESAPEVADGRLRGRRIALLALGELPGDVADAVEEAVDMGGGRLTRQIVLSPTEDLADLARALGGSRARLPSRLGRLIELGGVAARSLRRELPRRFSGRFGAPVDAVVAYRHPPAQPADDAARADLDLREGFEDALFEGLRDDVAGVELLSTEPSQVGWYEDQVIPSVDNADVPAGKLALVLVLEDAVVAGVAGQPAEGSFGYKDSAERPLPELGG